MSSAGRAESSSGCATKPKGREIGLTGFAVQIRFSSLTGSYVMATAEHREPYESRGSRTVLGAPAGEIPPGDSTKEPVRASSADGSVCPSIADILLSYRGSPLRAKSRLMRCSKLWLPEGHGSHTCQIEIGEAAK